ncbi:conserved hypothetical protein [Neospora caninum Liverpool]|uniref:Uncharacterized protein n=1 Tax=Neospora caninum (strain Liverpool) TaxID=572307 RepID=F0V7L5_NEOCL|nr:conserved hypothetical protein [Neospora caninum Liverpool]CBZ49706.1 conserved hypothetical protein [Neospora caninum Liverpool]CEL64291.1 TPA: hypothetical protein BN1204_001940 [Neospora caninum Liverpool]|eukprot:XP_003879741.1 conserved hypothetical protein [Neospora caninum Liverpool]
MGATSSSFQEDSTEPFEAAVAAGKQLAEWQLARLAILAQRRRTGGLEERNNLRGGGEQLPPPFSCTENCGGAEPRRGDGENSLSGSTAESKGKPWRRPQAQTCKRASGPPVRQPFTLFAVSSSLAELNPSARFRSPRRCQGTCSDGRPLATQVCVSSADEPRKRTEDISSEDIKVDSTRTPVLEEAEALIGQSGVFAGNSGEPGSAHQRPKVWEAIQSRERAKSVPCVARRTALFGCYFPSSAKNDTCSWRGSARPVDSEALSRSSRPRSIRSTSLPASSVSKETKRFAKDRSEGDFLSRAVFEPCVKVMDMNEDRDLEPERNPARETNNASTWSRASGHRDTGCWCSFSHDSDRVGTPSSSNVFRNSPGWPSQAAPLRLLLLLAPEISSSALPPLPHSDRRGTRCLINHSPTVVLLHTLYLLQQRVRSDDELAKGTKHREGLATFHSCCESRRGERTRDCEGRDEKPFLPPSGRPLPQSPCQKARTADVSRGPFCFSSHSTGEKKQERCLDTPFWVQLEPDLSHPSCRSDCSPPAVDRKITKENQPSSLPSAVRLDHGAASAGGAVGANQAATPWNSGSLTRVPEKEGRVTRFPLEGSKRRLLSVSEQPTRQDAVCPGWCAPSSTKLLQDQKKTESRSTRPSVSQFDLNRTHQGEAYARAQQGVSSQLFLPVSLPVASPVAQVLFGWQALAKRRWSCPLQGSSSLSLPCRSSEISEGIHEVRTTFVPENSTSASRTQLSFCSLPCVVLFVLQHFRAETHYLAPRLFLEGLLNAGLLFLFTGASCPAFLPGQTCIEAWEDQQMKSLEQESHVARKHGAKEEFAETKRATDERNKQVKTESIWVSSPSDLGFCGPPESDVTPQEKETRSRHSFQGINRVVEYEYEEDTEITGNEWLFGTSGRGAETTHRAVNRKTLFEYCVDTSCAVASPSAPPHVRSPVSSLALDETILEEAAGGKAAAPHASQQSSDVTYSLRAELRTPSSPLTHAPERQGFSFVSFSSGSALSLSLEMEFSDASEANEGERETKGSSARGMPSAVAKVDTSSQAAGRDGSKKESDGNEGPSPSVHAFSQLSAPASQHSAAFEDLASYPSLSPVLTEPSPRGERESKTTAALGVPQLDWMCGHFAMAVAHRGFVHKIAANLSRSRQFRHGPIPVFPFLAPLNGSEFHSFSHLASCSLPSRPPAVPLCPVKSKTQLGTEGEEERMEHSSFFTCVYPPPINRSVRRTVARHLGGRYLHTPAHGSRRPGGRNDEAKEKRQRRRLKRNGQEDGNGGEKESGKQGGKGKSSFANCDGQRHSESPDHTRDLEKSREKGEQAEKEEMRWHWRRRQLLYEECTGLTAPMAVYWQLREDFEVSSRQKRGGQGAHPGCLRSPFASEEEWREEEAREAGDFHVFIVDGTCRSRRTRNGQGQARDNTAGEIPRRLD